MEQTVKDVVPPVESTPAPKAKKKSLADLKATDTVVVAFKVPTATKDEDEEEKIQKVVSKNHLKYQFWLNLAKDEEGKPIHSSLRGATLIGYVDEAGKEVKF